MAALDLKHDILLLGAFDNVFVYNIQEDNVLRYDLPIVIPFTKKRRTSHATIVALSESSEILAVVTNKKEFLIYTKCDNKYNLACSHVLQRAASAMVFSRQSEKLLIADKSGDAYIAQKESSWTPTLILGHFSMLLDILITPDDKYIISCDRDEKIRVSSYPDTYNIVSYCLGHEEFVSALSLVETDHNMLFSVSGDRTLRAWRYTTGQQLLVQNLPEPATAMKVVSDNNRTHAVVLFYDKCQINIYNFTLNENIMCELLQSIDLYKIPASFSIFGNRVWFSSSGSLLEYVYDVNNKTYAKSEKIVCKPLLDFIASTDCCKIDDFICTLFKKQYDNLEEYHRRKQMRMNKDSSVSVK